MTPKTHTASTYLTSLFLCTLVALTALLMLPGAAYAQDAPSAQIGAQAETRKVTFHVTGQIDTQAGRELLSLANSVRSKEGVRALEWDTELERTAILRAAELALYYSHTRPDSSSFISAWPKSTSMGTENIGVGYARASEVHDGWVDSYELRQNMLNSTMHSFAAAEFVTATGNQYWVECFSDATSTASEGAATKGTTTVEVTSVASLVNLSLDTAGELNLTKGDARQLSLTVNEVNVAADDIRWSSSAPAVASVSDAGVVQALSEGTSQISASLSNSNSTSVSAYFKVVAGAGSWSRLAGATRYQTMSEVVSCGFATAEHAIVATGANFPDALAASAVAGTRRAPIILTASDALSAEARSQLTRLGVKSADIMGGPSAVSEATESAIKAMGITVTRIAGQDRMDTSVKALAATRAHGSTSDTVIVASGKSFADALAIGPWAWSTGSAIILTNSAGTLTDAEMAAIKADQLIKNVVICGGPAAVSDAVVNQLGSTYVFTRLGGATRYETAAGIATFEAAHGQSFATCGVATGANFPDALAGSALLGMRQGILLLAHDPADATVGLFSSHAREMGRGYLLGGESAVPASLANHLAGLTH